MTCWPISSASSWNTSASRVAENHQAEFRYDDSLIEAVLARCTEVDSGARNVDTILNGTLLPEIAGTVLARMARAGRCRPSSRRHQGGQVQVRRRTGLRDAMLNIEQLLAPISEQAPCGDDIAFSPEVDAISKARQADDPTLEQGAWVTSLKEADWKFVATLRAADRKEQQGLAAGGVAGRSLGQDIVVPRLGRRPDASVGNVRTLLGQSPPAAGRRELRAAYRQSVLDGRAPAAAGEGNAGS